MTSDTTKPSQDAELTKFIAASHEALAQQGEGNSESLLALWSHADDVALMGAVGGWETGFEQISATLSAVSRSLKTMHWETFTAENLATYVNGDLALTVEIERMTRQTEGKKDERVLRSTNVYRREAGQWRLIHRHGDFEDANALL